MHVYIHVLRIYELLHSALKSLKCIKFGISQFWIKPKAKWYILLAEVLILQIKHVQSKIRIINNMIEAEANTLEHVSLFAKEIKKDHLFVGSIRMYGVELFDVLLGFNFLCIFSMVYVW